MCISKGVRKRSNLSSEAPTQQPNTRDWGVLDSDEFLCDSMDFADVITKPSSNDVTHYQHQQHLERERLVVQHNYHDHAFESSTLHQASDTSNSRGGVATPFPTKLHNMLSKIQSDGLSHIVSWQPHGRCFAVHRPKDFVNIVMPRYFQQSKFASFQRQLNLYGFSRLTSGKDRGSYYHELFLRGREFLATRILRTKVKGTGARMASNPDAEPDFYAMSPVTPMTSSQQKRAQAKKVKASSQQSFNDRNFKSENDDVVLFEGMPFHYLERNEFNLSSVISNKTFTTLNSAEASSQPSSLISNSTMADFSRYRQFVQSESESAVVSDFEPDDELGISLKQIYRLTE